MHELPFGSRRIDHDRGILVDCVVGRRGRALVSDPAGNRRCGRASMALALDVCSALRVVNGCEAEQAFWPGRSAYPATVEYCGSVG